MRFALSMLPSGMKMGWMMLQDISCTIRKRKPAALTGISGGGKTFLFHLLLGIYSPNAGKILYRTGDKETPVCLPMKLF